ASEPFNHILQAASPLLSLPTDRFQRNVVLIQRWCCSGLGLIHLWSWWSRWFRQVVMRPNEWPGFGLPLDEPCQHLEPPQSEAGSNLPMLLDQYLGPTDSDVPGL